MHFFREILTKNVMCYFDQNFKNHQVATTATVAVYNAQTVPGSQQRAQIVNFELEEFTCNFTPKITMKYTSYETPDKNSENSSANDDRNMNMVPNENTFQGIYKGSNANLLSSAVMEKISTKTKPPEQCHIENCKNPENCSKINHRFHFFSSPFQLVRRLLRMEDIAPLGAMTPR